MPLELVVDSLDSVPPALHGEYAEKDGKFHLNVNGLPDTSGLQKDVEKLRKENAERRTTAKALEDKVKRWESLGKSDTEIQEMLDAAEVAKQEALKKSGDQGAIIADLTNKHKTALEKERTSWAAEKTALENTLNLARSSERKAIVNTNVTASLTKAKATAEGLDLLIDRLGNRVVFEDVDGERVIRVMQADGKTPMAGKGAGGNATFDDLVAEATEKYPSLFEGTGAGGGGKSPREGAAGNSGGKTISRADWDKLNPWEHAAKLKAGFKPAD